MSPEPRSSESCGGPAAGAGSRTTVTEPLRSARAATSSDLASVGPPGEGRICEPTVETVPAERRANEPLPSQPVPERTNLSVRWVGAVRLPLAGPYRPIAHLYSGPDGARWWTVRLWEHDRPRERILPEAALLAFAQANRLAGLADAIGRLLARARAEDRA